MSLFETAMQIDRSDHHPAGSQMCKGFFCSFFGCASAGYGAILP